MERDDLGPGPAQRAPGTVDDTTAILRLLVETVRDYAIFALDPSGHILTWNAGAERLKGYTAREAIGKHFSMFYPRQEIESRHPWHELEWAAAEGQYEEEGWRLRKDGQRFWANVVITALRDETGTLVGYAKVTRDLTERMMAEEALRQSEERFHLLVDSVQDYGIFMLDPEGNVMSWNAGAERIKGYTESEIVGRHFSVFYRPEDRAAGRPGRNLEAALREGRFEDEGWRVRKDGTPFWGNVVITTLRRADGEVIGFAKVTRDLTERRAAEEKALEDARRVAEAEAANRAKGEFLAAMSHELRTPLNAIGGYVDLLAFGVHGEMTEPQLQALDRVSVSQRHLLKLITDLLNFSKIEAGRVSYELLPVNLAEAAESVRPMIEPQALAGEITLHWQGADADADVAIVAIADRKRVEQILLNLLTNAVKYTERGGDIRIRHYTTDECAALEVEDSGVGIPQDQLESVFEPFTQIGRTLTSAHEGTGLGLAISRDLARAMGGDLVARSTLGEGSTFTLKLPLRE